MVRTTIISVAGALLLVGLVVGLLEIRSKALALPAFLRSPAPAEIHAPETAETEIETEARAD